MISNQLSVRRLHPEPHIHHEAHEEHEGFIILQSFGLFCLYGCPLLSTVQLRRAVPCLDIKIHFVSFVVKSFPIRRIKNDIFTEEHKIMLQNKSFHSLLKDFYIEIHQQANLFSREFHIS